MNPNNPLQKSLEETYFEGGKDYQYGGYIPPIVLESPNTSPTPTSSPTPTKTPTPTPTATDTRACRTYTIIPSGYAFIGYLDCSGNTQTIGLFSSYQLCAKQGSVSVDFGSATITDIGSCPLETPTPTPSSTPTKTPTPTQTSTNTATPTPTSSPGSSPTPTPSITPTISVSPTRTPTPTPTISVSPSQTPTRTPTQTPTKTPTMTPTGTKTPTPTPTLTATPTITPTQTRTPTPTPSCASCCRRYSVFNESYTLTGVIRYTACNCFQVSNKQVPPRATQVYCCNTKCACVGGNFAPTSAQSFIKITEIGCC